MTRAGTKMGGGMIIMVSDLPRAPKGFTLVVNLLGALGRVVSLDIIVG